MTAKKFQVKKVFIAPIEFYRKHISPAKPPCCKYYPTCSGYAIQAIDEWGVVRGLGLASWRILRCNPLSRGGFDPVPVNKKRRNKTNSDKGGDQARE